MVAKLKLVGEPRGLMIFVTEIVADATVKHSVVELVCEDGEYVPSPEYSARQQYLPSTVVFDVASDVAIPRKLRSSPSAGVPIWVPAVPSQPPAVTWLGWQRKNLALPVGTGRPTVPVTVAVSVTGVPR